MTRPQSRKSTGGKASGRGVRFILFLGDEGGILVMVQGGKVTRRLFAPGPEAEHLRSFRELMEEHPRAPISLMVDMIDQSYVRHTLPPVSAMSVGKLVQRRLERDFAPEDIKGALPLGREKSGRKEWNFLLISLANSALLQRWMDVILELPNQFKGMFLVPVEAQSLISALTDTLIDKTAKEPSRWQLLVSHDKVSGFRQVVLKEGQLIFTRLTNAQNDASNELLAGSIEQEVMNTIEYLRRLGYDEASGLDLFLISAQEIRDAVDPAKFNTRNSQMLTPFDASEALGLEQAALSADRFGDVILATYFGMTKKRRLKLMPAYAKKIETLYMARLGARAVAALITVAVLGMSAMSLLNAITVSGEKEKFVQEKNAVTENLARIQRDLEQLGEDATSLIEIAALYNAVNPYSIEPLAFVKELSTQMQGNSLVKNIEWKRVDPTGASDSAAPVPAVPGAAEKFEAKLEMEFINHGGSKELLRQHADSFLTRLREHLVGFTVTNEALPGVTGSDENLSVNFDDPSAQSTSLAEGEDVIEVTISGPNLEGTPPDGQ